MNQPKKNTTIAQASLELNTEAALKLMPQALKPIKSQKEPEHGDGDGGPPDGAVIKYEIEVAENGFFVTICWSAPDIADSRYIVHTMAEVIELLKGGSI